MTYYAQLPSPLGAILLSASATHLIGLHFMDQKDCPDVPGRLAVRPDSLDPSAGRLDELPIRQFRAHKADSARLDSSARSAPTAALGKLVLLQDDTAQGAAAIFGQAHAELAAYFSGSGTRFNTPMAPPGTVFQQQVWTALLNVPFGDLLSYGQLAIAAGLSGAHGRAVGMAVGRNPITIMVPCHRVLSSTQRLTGYTGGLERKLALLKIEGYTCGRTGV